MIAVPLGHWQRYAVVGSPGYFKEHGKPSIPTDLLNHRCVRVRLPDGTLFRWRFEKDGEIAQIDVRGSLMIDEASLARAAVMAGLGIGCFMEQDVLADIEAGVLTRVLEDWTPPLSRVCLYYPNRRNLSAGLRAFIDLAREWPVSRATLHE